MKTTKMDDTPPTRRIAMLAFESCDLLDVCGPLDVFAFANVWFRLSGQYSDPVYEVKIVAEQSGPVRSFSGVQVIADYGLDDPLPEFDTVLIAGGPDVEAARRDPHLKAWIQAMSPRVRRLGSVCTGAFLLAEAGLLEGRKATTHWAYCQRLSEAFPAIKLDPDRIFVRDGAVYTSGGVTSGIDLAFYMVEEDFGHEAATAIARGMVMFPNRPGGQTQFSRFFMGDERARRDFRDLQDWIAAHPQEDLSVEALAQRVCMSPRNFARVFDKEVGMPPAKFVERARMTTALFYLEQTLLPVDAIAQRVGFGTSENMRRSFQRNLKVSPLDYRQRFRSPSADMGDEAPAARTRSKARAASSQSQANELNS